MRGGSRRRRRVRRGGGKRSDDAGRKERTIAAGEGRAGSRRYSQCPKHEGEGIEEANGDSGGGGGGGGRDGVGMNTPAPQYRGGNRDVRLGAFLLWTRLESPGRRRRFRLWPFVRDKLPLKESESKRNRARRRRRDPPSVSFTRMSRRFRE